jgi:hypothetical protein
VFVFKTIAYIQTLDEYGQPVMERYHVKKYAREYIVKFDHGEPVQPGGFVFHRPNKSQTLKYKQESGIKLRAAGKVSPRTTQGKKVKVKTFSLRSGKGKVHLFGNEDQIRVNPQNE